MITPYRLVTIQLCSFKNDSTKIQELILFDFLKSYKVELALTNSRVKVEKEYLMCALCKPLSILEPLFVTSGKKKII